MSCSRDSLEFELHRHDVLVAAFGEEQAEEAILVEEGEVTRLILRAQGEGAAREAVHLFGPVFAALLQDHPLRHVARGRFDLAGFPEEITSQIAETLALWRVDQSAHELCIERERLALVCWRDGRRAIVARDRVVAELAPADHRAKLFLGMAAFVLLGVIAQAPRVLLIAGSVSGIAVLALAIRALLGLHFSVARRGSKETA